MSIKFKTSEGVEMSQVLTVPSDQRVKEEQNVILAAIKRMKQNASKCKTSLVIVVFVTCAVVV